MYNTGIRARFAGGRGESSPHCSAASHLLQWPKTIPGGSVGFPGHCLKVINIKEFYGVI